MIQLYKYAKQQEGQQVPSSVWDLNIYQDNNESHTGEAPAKVVWYFFLKRGFVTDATHKHHDAYCPLQH